MVNKRLYILSTYRDDDTKVYKIGFTKKAVKDRVKQLQTGNHNEINIEYIYEADDYIVKIETMLHKYFSIYRVSGEWFELPDDKLSTIPRLCEKLYNNFKYIDENSTYI